MSTRGATAAKLELLCLGTGQGATFVYDGQCSAAYALLLNEMPVLLIGAGGGVVQQCLRYFGYVPGAIFVSNNRSHSAAELPVVLSAEAKKERRLKVIAEGGVCLRLQTQRLGELHQTVAAKGVGLDDLCEFVPLTALPLVADNPTVSAVERGWLVRSTLNMASVAEVVPHVYLSVVKTPATTELSAAAIVSVGESAERSVPVAAISGDSGFSEEFYSTLAAYADVLVVDARLNGTPEHSSFDQIELFASSQRPSKVVLVGHFGMQSEAPAAATPYLQPFPEGSAALLAPTTGHGGEVSRWLGEALDSLASKSFRPAVSLRPFLPPSARPQPELSRAEEKKDPEPMGAGPHVYASPAKSEGRNRSGDSPRGGVAAPRPRAMKSSPPSRAAGPRTPSPRIGHHYPTTNASEYDPKKVLLFNNELKMAEGVLIMAHHFRTFHQLRMRAGKVLGLAPVGELHLLPSGLPVQTLQDIPNGSCVVVTRRWGQKFSWDELPVVLRKKFAKGHDNSSTIPSDPV